ncbi:SpoIID/LytB domain-containing protein [Keratinibaculum paraultunense]|nr:SpoIID/LytB domain-containing protein [Keratinibaculum paraultunense]
MDDYISIKLTSPVKSREIVKLGSDDGFYVYGIKNFEDEYISNQIIYIELNDDKIEVKDDIGEILFSIPEDNLILSSGNKCDSIIKVEDKRYRDCIEIKKEKNGLSVINLVKMDHYLYGVVPREMPASFPIEALKAQAIAARTYTLKNINKHYNEGYNLCDTTHCQIYGGMDEEHVRTNEAVDATKGKIITYNGEIIDALYHSNSGGHTEDSVEAWGNYFPYLVGVKDEFSIGQPNSEWYFTIDSYELNSKLKNNGIYIGDIIDLEILKTSPRGGITSLKIIGTAGEKILNKGEIRQVFGDDKLKSTWFSIKREGTFNPAAGIYAISGENEEPKKIDISKAISIDKNLTKNTVKEAVVIEKDKTSRLVDSSRGNNIVFLIEGRGYGHGVGMSQWGAKKMAEEGYTYEEILKHYYTGVEIN